MDAIGISCQSRLGRLAGSNLTAADIINTVASRLPPAIERSTHTHSLVSLRLITKRPWRPPARCHVVSARGSEQGSMDYAGAPRGDRVAAAVPCFSTNRSLARVQDLNATTSERIAYRSCRAINLCMRCQRKTETTSSVVPSHSDGSSLNESDRHGKIKERSPYRSKK